MSEARRQALLEAVECAIAHRETGCLSDADATLRDAKVSPAEAPAVVYFHASILMAMKRWPHALSLMNALTDLLPHEATVHLGRATCLLSMGDLDGARAVLNKEDSVLGHFLRYILLARIAAREGKLTQSAGLLREACGADVVGAFMVLERPRLAAVMQGIGNMTIGQSARGYTSASLSSVGYADMQLGLPRSDS